MEPRHRLGSAGPKSCPPAHAQPQVWTAGLQPWQEQPSACFQVVASQAPIPHGTAGPPRRGQGWGVDTSGLRSFSYSPSQISNTASLPGLSLWAQVIAMASMGRLGTQAQLDKALSLPIALLPCLLSAAVVTCTHSVRPWATHHQRGDCCSGGLAITGSRAQHGAHGTRLCSQLP